MAAAVDLEEQARLAHRLAAGPVAARSARTDCGQTGLAQDPAQRAGRQDDPLTLGQQVCQVSPIDPRVRRQGELHQAVVGRGVDAVDGAPTEVAVD